MPGLITGDFQLLIMSPVTRDSCPTHACPSSTINYPPVNKSTRPSFLRLFSILSSGERKAIKLVLQGLQKRLMRWLKITFGIPNQSSGIPRWDRSSEKLPDGANTKEKRHSRSSALVKSTHKALHVYSKCTQKKKKKRVKATAGGMTC